jgi:hypothetical protein
MESPASRRLGFPLQNDFKGWLSGDYLFGNPVTQSGEAAL